MKILVVSQFYSPDITAAAFRISETAGYLRSFGHEVQVVTSHPYKNPDNPVRKHEDSVHRVRLPNTEGKGFVGYMYLYLSFLIKSLVAGYNVGKRMQPDVIWASSPPIFVGLSGWILAKLLNVPLVLDIRDIWPDSAVAAGQLSDSGVAYKLGSLLEGFLYRHADRITCVANPMKKYIKTYTEIPVDVIYNGVDIQTQGIKKSRDLVHENKLDIYSGNDKTKKLLYAGNFGHVQQLEVAIEALSEMKQDKLSVNWELFLLGGGVKKEFLETMADTLEVAEKVHFLDPVPKKLVGAYLDSADALFIHLQDSEVLKLTIPSKVFDYMLADKPILAGIGGEGRDILSSIDTNILFQPGNVESLKEGLYKLDDIITDSLHVKENSKLVKQYYSRESQARKLDQLFSQLV